MPKNALYICKQVFLRKRLDFDEHVQRGCWDEFDFLLDFPRKAPSDYGAILIARCLLIVVDVVLSMLQFSTSMLGGRRLQLKPADAADGRGRVALLLLTLLLQLIVEGFQPGE